MISDDSERKKEQTNIRLSVAIKEAAKARAEAERLNLNDLVEKALEHYLSTDSTPDNSGSSVDSRVVADLIARVEALEAAIAHVPTPSPIQDPPKQAKAPKQVPERLPKQPVPQQQSPLGDEPVMGGPTNLVSLTGNTRGMTITDALLTAGALDKHPGGNYDRAMLTRYGEKAKPWLKTRGWRLQGRKWFPPEN